MCVGGREGSPHAICRGGPLSNMEGGLSGRVSAVLLSGVIVREQCPEVVPCASLGVKMQVQHNELMGSKGAVSMSPELHTVASCMLPCTRPQAVLLTLSVKHDRELAVCP
jgi:hypothetical protein